jgi:hypothetical protein
MKNILIIFALLYGFLDLSCEEGQEPIVIYDNGTSNDDIVQEYTFIEIKIHSFVQKLESGPRNRSSLCGGKLYNYDINTGKLELYYLSDIEKEVLKSTNLICAAEYVLPWELGDGTFNNSKVIGALPENLEYFDLKTLKNNKILINYFRENKDINISFRERIINLKNKSSINFIDEYNTENDFGKFFVRDTIIIFNHGKQNKNKIVYKNFHPC